MGQGTSLGAFTLQARIGVGGMGEVWSGRHRDQDVPVAIKILAAEEARRPAYLTAFRAEVHAVARLSHPGIIALLDCGAVPDHPELRALGIEPSLPYLVMRRAHGALSNVPLPLPWPAVRGVLLRLLDALAHAHARGVIHRDLKPENVLIHREPEEHGEARQSLWLSDFGIARLARPVVDPGDAAGAFEDGTIVGTPGYMAPEQLRGALRDQGPWTDLYALGCLAWALLAGRPPMETGRPLPALLLERMTQELPGLPEGLAPKGVGRWIAKLTANDPAERFQRAADAAAAFPGHGAVGPLELPLLGSPPSEPSGDSTTVAVTTGQALTTLAAVRREVGTAPSSPPPSGASRLPLPESCRRPTLPPPALPLVGAGLALHGVKPPPLCGRRAERDQLWDALRRVVGEGRPRAVLIRGAAGMGKSRLAQWLAQRAHEVGACEVIEATHGPTPGHGDGLPAAVARHLRCEGLPFTELHAHLIERLVRDESADYEALALATWLAPTATAVPDPLPHAFATPTERDEVVRRLLDGLAAKRPLLLWLDDLQWAPQAIAFLRRFLARSPAPVLVVATLQEEALAATPASAAQLEELPRTETLALGPLSEEDHTTLVRHMLRLESELARDVALKTRGNPLFVGQLFSEWIARDALRITSDGFTLREGLAVGVPADLRGMWTARLERLLAGRPASDRRALELAATLGQRIERREWARACDLAGGALDPAWVETLLAGQVLERRGVDVAFVHGLLRAMIESDAAERAESLHEVALALLDETGHDDAERRGHHLAALGRHEEAAGLLLEGARDRIGSCDYTRAAALLDRREASLDALTVEPASPARVEGELVRAWLLRLEGRLDEAEAMAREAHERATDPRLEGIGELRLGEIAMRRGLLHDAERWLTPAREGALARGDTKAAALAQWNLAWVELLRGRPLAAEKLLTPLIPLTRGPGWSVARRLHVLWATGFVRLNRGQLEKAEETYREAEALSRAHGDNRLALAHARFGLGAIAERRGELAEAERLAEIALGHYEEIQASETHFATHLLGRIRRARGDREGARVLLERGRQQAAGNRPLVEARFRAALLPLDAEEGRWDAMRQGLAATVALTQRTGSVDVYSGDDAALAAALAERAGRDEDAAALRRFAESQHRDDDRESG